MRFCLAIDIGASSGRQKRTAKQASSAISGAETEGLYTITEKEFNDYFKEQDAANWRRLDNGVHLTEDEKAEIHEEVEDNRLHNELLSKLWADRRMKIEQDKFVEKLRENTADKIEYE